jgi:glycosyltransferase involved in cell wall biosynthesis
MVKVSVLMSVYNDDRYLRQAVDSVLAQTFTDYEFIIVDDGSSDESTSILDGYTDPRIVRLRNEQNIGLADSLNRALMIARGQYIARMDADDISMPERLVKQVDFLDTHPEVGVLGTGFEILDDCENRDQSVAFPVESGMVRWHLYFYCPIVHPSVMVRREVYERLGGYDTDICHNHSEDYELWHRAKSITELANLPDILLQLRKHDQNKSIVNESYALKSILGVDQKAITLALGRLVTQDCVRGLRTPTTIESPQETLDVADVLHDLCLATLNEVTEPEKKLIKRDAAIRLYNISLLCSRMSVLSFLRIWIMSVWLYPKSVSWIFRDFAKRPKHRKEPKVTV